MALDKYKGFVIGDKLPPENVDSIDPNNIQLVGKLIGGQDVSPMAKWGAIISPIGETEEISVVSTASNYNISAATTFISQSFTMTKDVLISALFYITKYGSPTWDITAEIYAADGSDQPTGALIASFTMDGTKIVNGENMIDFGKLVLTSGNKYCIIFKVPLATGSNYYNFYYGGSYAGGQGKYSTNSGSSWNNLSDFWMKIRMATAADSVPKYSANINDVLYADNYLNLPYLSSNKAEFNENTSGSYMSIYGSYLSGQTFTPTERNFFDKISVHLSKYNSPTGTITLGIYEAAAGLPTGSALASATLDVATLTASATWRDFVFASPIELEIGKQYVFQISLPGNNSSNYLRVYNYTSSSVYSGGTSIYWNGSTWTTNTTQDLVFIAYAAYIPTATEIAAIIQEQIRALTGSTEVVEYTDSRFIISTADSILKLISPSDGTDISGNVSDGATGYYLDLGINATEIVRNTSEDDLVRLDSNKQIPSKVLDNAIKVTILQTTRGYADSNSVETIAHGLGKVPKFVEIKARHARPNSSSSTEGGLTLVSDGFSDGTNNKCVYVAETSIGANPYFPKIGDGNSSSAAVYMRKMLSGDSYANSYLLQSAVITFDETNIYIAWTKASGGQSPAAITGTFYLTLLAV